MSAIDSLASLHTTLIDTKRGYEEAVKDAEDPALAAVFQRMVALRDRDHEEVHRALIALGATPDESGSFMSTVHRTVVGLRSALVGLGPKSLLSFADGEDHVLAAYDNALAEFADHPELADRLEKQRQGVLSAVAAMKATATG